MVHTFLEEGEELVDVLRDQYLPVTAALWWYFDDENHWRLLVVTPKVDEDGPLKTYAVISDVFGRIRPCLRLDMNRVSVMSTKGESFQKLKSALGTQIAISSCYYPDAKSYVYVWDGQRI